MFIKQGNNAILSGVVGKDPELKVFNKNGKNSQIINLGVVVGRADNDKGIWKNCYAWGSALKDVKKGDKIFITGNLEEDTFTGKDGVDRQSEKINIDYFNIIPKVEKKEKKLETIEDNLPF